MAFNSYYFNILIRVLLILCNSLVASYMILQANRFFSIVFFSVLLLVQVFLLFRYLTKVNRNLAAFLMRLKEQDFMSQVSDSNIRKTFPSLQTTMDRLTGEISKMRLKSQERETYIASLIEGASSGFLTFDEQGTIEVFNPYARQLLQVSSASRVSELSHIPGLPEFLYNLKPQKPEVFSLKSKNGILPVSCSAAILKFQGKTIRMISLKDVKTEMDQKELDSWQKLIRVLTHEIMNSITPITTMTVAIRRKLQGAPQKEQEDDFGKEILADLISAIDLIEDRGKSLMQFVNGYRHLTLLPVPSFASVPVEPLLAKTERLFLEECRRCSVALIAQCEPADLIVQADQAMVEQVLINLVRNSLQALKTTEIGTIRIRAKKEQDNVLITVADNGTGIPGEMIDQIFIPFFTTKQNGSGIGLSLARQIMSLHKGDIQVISEPGKETVFALRFPDIHQNAQEL
jgi:two-component system, NtrC family, nitrogen regulation sensor histidine kinase NtrY